ncbi:MAG: inositol monophosphatase [Nitrospirae bacterium CG_4_8_14_3_um_filter_70_85]|nr:inositol monophosphatase [Deltaproteobacteria bacterium]NCP96586.1 inositol monophosphatase [Deltaproteobacteria bacterium]PIW82934.1 MAG: inositol monophosphatase [Nitrospirae bacterium CG_4_8_14_3_um_filter_70_85]PJB95983.1 MAG: inositol monophosphatase [Nitrospirae bacterium CG_4_9_14_0_8_um_filter_70_14]
MADEWQQYLVVAVALAREAGTLLLDYQRRGFTVATKQNAIDLVTDADRAAEARVVAGIRARFPDHAILAEEGGAQGAAVADRPRWIIDPLDGTTNFAHGYPFYCCAIGVEVAGRVVAGVVEAPALGERFTATAGGGAYLEHASVRRRLAVSATAELRQALLVTGFPYDITSRGEAPFVRFARFVRATQGVRRDGSAALDLCYVACGRFDGFWEENLKPWDLAAATCIAREAGARFSALDGGRYSIHHGDLIAANPHLHPAMVALARHDPPPTD